jgi:hypothetical protein
MISELPCSSKHRRPAPRTPRRGRPASRTPSLPAAECAVHGGAGRASAPRINQSNGVGDIVVAGSRCRPCECGAHRRLRAHRVAAGLRGNRRRRRTPRVGDDGGRRRVPRGREGHTRDACRAEARPRGPARGAREKGPQGGAKRSAGVRKRRGVDGAEEGRSRAEPAGHGRVGSVRVGSGRAGKAGPGPAHGLPARPAE